jgi:CPA2 family monovalent cation:H+ antiporter-2
LDRLRSEGLGTVFLGEAELARGMARHVLERFAPEAAAPLQAVQP